MLPKKAEAGEKSGVGAALQRWLKQTYRGLLCKQHWWAVIIPGHILCPLLRTDSYSTPTSVVSPERCLASLNCLFCSVLKQTFLVKLLPIQCWLVLSSVKLFADFLTIKNDTTLVRVKSCFLSALLQSCWVSPTHSCRNCHVPEKQFPLTWERDEREGTKAASGCTVISHWPPTSCFNILHLSIGFSFPFLAARLEGDYWLASNYESSPRKGWESKRHCTDFE